MEFVFFRCYYCTANIKPQQTVKLNSQHKAKNERRKPKNKPHHVYTYGTLQHHESYGTTTRIIENCQYCEIEKQKNSQRPKHRGNVISERRFCAIVDRFVPVYQLAFHVQYRKKGTMIHSWICPITHCVNKRSEVL